MINRNPNNKSFSIGAYAFVEQYYSKLGLHEIIGMLKSKGIPLDKLVRGMLTFKIDHNQSVHQCSDWMNQLHILNQFKLKSFHEKTLYRGLEILGQNESIILPKIQHNLFSNYKFEHTDSNLDWSSLVMYGNASPLGKFGFSSDHRPDKKQITFGIGELRKPINIPFVLTIKEGNVPGKTHFKDTFLQSVKHLKPESLIVIDRGANTRPNKRLVGSKEMHYLTARILSNKDNALISGFSKANARKIIRKKNKEVIYCKKIKQQDEFLYICFSPKLYEHQITRKGKKIDQELAVIKQLSDKLKAGKKIKQKSISLPDKILTHEVSLQTRLIGYTDQQIKEHLKEIHINGREGFYILESTKNLTEKQAVEIYKNKDSVEKTISSLKNEIEIKPLRVWTDSSIKGALIIGFLAQLFISLVRFESEKLKHLSTTTILKSVKNLTVTIKNSGNALIEQIISNIDWISREIMPDLVSDPG
jgi:transposase